jgi:hypothetical protein
LFKPQIIRITGILTRNDFLKKHNKATGQSTRPVAFIQLPGRIAKQNPSVDKDAIHGKTYTNKSMRGYSLTSWRLEIKEPYPLDTDRNEG